MKGIFNTSLNEKIKKKKNLFLFLSITGYSLTLIGATSIQVRNGIIGDVLKPIIKKNISIPSSYFKSLFVDVKPLILDIKHENILKISETRKKAVKIGELFPTDDDWIKTKVALGNKNYEADIRLKGQYIDHWRDDGKWSYKIKVKGRNAILGMKRFAIQHPRTRNYMNEWYFHKMSKNAGLIAPRYIFNPLVINGEKYPVYALEENFDTKLIENNDRREGPIFRIRSRGNPFNKRITGVFFYQKNKLNSTEIGKLSSRRAERLIQGFFNEELDAEEVFDLKLMARATVVCDLFGHHALEPRNIRYYLNPITGLVEPILFDNANLIRDFWDLSKSTLFGERYSQRGDKKYVIPISEINNAKIHSMLFSNKKFSKAYGQALQEMSSLEWLDNFFSSIDNEANRNLSILHRSYPWYEFDYIEDIYRNAAHIRFLINPNDALIAYLEEFDDPNKSTKITVKNNHSLPLEIIRVETQEGEEVLNLEANPKFISNRSISCTEDKCQKEKLNTHNYEEIYLPKKNKINKKLRFISRVVGTSNYISDPIFRKYELEGKLPNLKDLNFLKINEVNKSITMKGGNWTIKDNLLIPKGYVFNINSGTLIDLTNSASIISYSPINFIGIVDNPIIIKSSDSSGQGLTVLNAPYKSILKNVIFRDQSERKKAGITYTGSVNFYESDVEISNVIFRDNSSEDSLNIIRSNFKIDRSTFYNTFSDALDVDFGKGEILNSQFYNIGNDGIDVSKSEVRIRNIKMNNVGDKGVSAGENSQVDLKSLQVNNAMIGISMKDNSYFKGDKVQLNLNNIGVASYQKKPEFGPAEAELTNISIENSKKSYLIEKRSKFTLDNKLVNPNAENVYEKIYGLN